MQAPKNKNDKEIDLFKDKEEENKGKSLSEISKNILNNKFVSIVIFLFTLFCLFSSDIKLACICPAKYDIIFNIISIFGILIFSLEIVFSIFSDSKYLFSFFF